MINQALQRGDKVRLVVPGHRLDGRHGKVVRLCLVPQYVGESFAVVKTGKTSYPATMDQITEIER